jgi:hypothetical protein
VTVKNPIVFAMAEVLTQNAESKLQRGEEIPANRPSSLVRSLFFKYYIHDSVPTLRFQLVGDLRASNVSELNGSWETARTTLSLRRFVLDVSQVYSTDDEGRNWLFKMREAGAAFLPMNYLESPSYRPKPSPAPERAATVKPSLLGRVLGRIRGER